ncbi:uncharacterized protein V6R79_016245 [Siganus canaliculatus]
MLIPDCSSISLFAVSCIHSTVMYEDAAHGPDGIWRVKYNGSVKRLIMYVCSVDIVFHVVASFGRNCVYNFNANLMCRNIMRYSVIVEELAYIKNGYRSGAPIGSVPTYSSVFEKTCTHMTDVQRAIFSLIHHNSSHSYSVFCAEDELRW